MSVSASGDLRAILGPRSQVRSVFQPIVELEGRRIIGYEALARFADVPADMGPVEVFARARDEGLLADLDWECRRAAFQGAADGGLVDPLHLFVNVEPSVLGSPPPWRVDPAAVAAAVARVPIVVELTERSLLADPRSVLAATDWARSQSCMVALDDVGANPDSVTMLDIIRPDVIKLDRSMLSDEYTDDQRRTLRAVWDHVARTGAHILCEGVESERDLDRARGCGASLAQGYHLGRPRDLEIADEVVIAARQRPAVLRISIDLVPSPPPDPTTLLRGDRLRVSAIGEIAKIGAAFDALRSDRGADGCVLLSLHDPALYTSWLARRYGELARSNSLVGIIGVGEDVPPGVRGSRVQPIRDHFAYVSIDPEFAMAIVGRDLGDVGEVAERRYEWVFTRDHTEVIDVARSLLRRLPAARRDHEILDRAAPEGVRSALSEIVATAVRVIPGVESAGLTLRSPTGDLDTMAASDQYPFLMDLLQQRYDEGPSLDVAQRDPVTRIDNFGSDGRWMSFRAAVVIAAPIASVLSFRLFDGPGATGFLTLYSQEDQAFDTAAVDSAYALAAYTSTAWTRLRVTLDTASSDAVTEFDRTPLSDVLDAATAVVMHRDEVSSLSAMRSILEASATTGTPLQQTAHRLVASNGSPSTPIPATDFGSAGSP